MDILYDDILCIICNYLNYFDMSKIADIFHCEKIKNSFTPEKYINDRLKMMGINSKEFNDSLQRSNSIVSGSFPLQCLLGEYWNSDIDIYNNHSVPYYHPNKNNNFYDYRWLEKIFETNSNKIKVARIIKDDSMYEYEDKQLIESFNCDYGYCINGLHNINYLVDFDINKNQCQFIIYKNNILDKFDFDFCKLKYDGNKLYFIENMNIIKYKTITLKKNYIIDSYNQQFQNYHYDKDKRDEYIEKTLKRMDKYKKRGFVFNVLDKLY